MISQAKHNLLKQEISDTFKDHQYIELLGEYVSANDQVEVRCKTCGQTFKRFPKSIIKKQHLRCCSSRFAIEEGHTTILSEQEFLKRVHKINPNIEVIGKYKGGNYKIDYRCTVCGTIKNTQSSTLFMKRKCYKCQDNERIQKVYDVAQDNNLIVIEIKDNSTFDKARIVLKCNDCDKIFETNYTAFTRTEPNISFCPVCSMKKMGENKTKSHDDFVKEFSTKLPNFAVESDYAGCDKKIKVRCLLCGGVFERTPNHLFMSGKFCPLCQQARSRGESKISEFLKQYDIHFIQEHKFRGCRNKRQLPFDFYLPKYNLCIEFDGEQHITGCFKKNSFDENIFINDEIKNQFCQLHQINLMRIPYVDLKNIDEILYNKFLVMR